MDVSGHWELTLIQRWRGEGMVVFLPFFIYFARLVAIIGRSNSKKCIIYLLKTVLEVLVVMVFSAFGKILTLTLEAHVPNIAYQAYAQLFQ